MDRHPPASGRPMVAPTKYALHHTAQTDKHIFISFINRHPIHVYDMMKIQYNKGGLPWKKSEKK